MTHKIQLLPHMKHSVSVPNTSWLTCEHGLWHVACALRWSGKEVLAGDVIHQEAVCPQFNLRLFQP
jgi:hypothetical protein